MWDPHLMSTFLLSVSPSLSAVALAPTSRCQSSPHPPRHPTSPPPPRRRARPASAPPDQSSPSCHQTPELVPTHSHPLPYGRRQAPPLIDGLTCAPVLLLLRLYPLLLARLLPVCCHSRAAAAAAPTSGAAEVSPKRRISADSGRDRRDRGLARATNGPQADGAGAAGRWRTGVCGHPASGAAGRQRLQLAGWSGWWQPCRSDAARPGRSGRRPGAVAQRARTVAAGGWWPGLCSAGVRWPRAAGDQDGSGGWQV
uniref:Uncharacterized protein n=1 Tax=Setaria italica TaxID=4555 RepID=K3Y9K5_SETIT